MRTIAPPVLPTLPYYLLSILNITPDSFSDGGRFYDKAACGLRGSERLLEKILAEAQSHLADGAQILDIGGESTRPGAQPLSAAEEHDRVIPVLELLHTAFPDAILSIDTRKAPVAKAAVAQGAGMINDISGLQYDGQAMAAVAADSGAYLVLMHSQGKPETMQHNPVYDNIIADLLAFFQTQIDLAVSCGVSKEKIILDPGFGFGKTLPHNLSLLKHLSAFKSLGCPVMAGTSRKSFLTLGRVAEIPPAEREPLTAASLAMAMAEGASFFRVHAPAIHAPVLQLIHQTLTTH